MNFHFIKVILVILALLSHTSASRSSKRRRRRCACNARKAREEHEALEALAIKKDECEKLGNPITWSTEYHHNDFSLPPRLYLFENPCYGDKIVREAITSPLITFVSNYDTYVGGIEAGLKSGSGLLTSNKQDFAMDMELRCLKIK